MSNPDRELAASIRTETSDDSELKASLQQVGWHPEFPAIADEFGTVLVGNRRLRIATELGIKPVIKTIKFGDGKEADAERIKLALISNLGGAPLSAKDRKRIAEHLYGKPGWTMEKVAEALNVNHATISRDLAEFVQPAQIKKHARSATNLKGAGRPKGSKADPQPRGKKAETREERAALLADAGLSTKEIAAEMGLGERAVSQSLEHVKIARDAEAKARAKLPEITIDMLSLSERKKAEAWLRQREREFTVTVEGLVRQRMRKEIDEIILPHYYAKEAEFDEVVKARKGVWTLAEYKAILRCLHPDSRTTASDAVLKRAFELLEKRKLVLVKEEEQPSPSSLLPPLPTTYADWEKRRAEVAAKRSKQRQRGTDVPTRR